MSWFEESLESHGGERLGEPQLVRTADDQKRDYDGVWVRSELAPSLSLRRILAVTSLTPAQVAVIGLGILAGLDALEAVGTAHGALHAGNVHVGLDGQVWLSDGGLPPQLDGGVPSSNQRASDAAAVIDLLTAMAGDPRRQGAAWRVPAVQRLMETARAVRRAAVQNTGNRAAIDQPLCDLRREAMAVLPDGTHERAAGEVGALVRALSPQPGTPVIVHSPECPPPHPLPIPQLSRRARRWVIACALAVAVCLCAAFLGWRWLKHSHRPVALPIAVAVLVHDRTTFMPPVEAGVRGS